MPLLKNLNIHGSQKVLIVVLVAFLTAAGFLVGLVPKTRAFRAHRMQAYLDTVKERRVNVVFITIDTIRQDRVSAYRKGAVKTPNLDAFFARGVGFTNANTCVPITLPSHVSILTGFYPTFHGVRDNGLYALRKTGITVTEALRERGYSTAAFVSSFVLNKKFGLDKGFDVYDDDLSDSFLRQIEWNLSGNIYPGTYNGYERRADEVTAAASEWLDQNRQTPFFLWVHYYDPHAPYYAYNSDLSSIEKKTPPDEQRDASMESVLRESKDCYDTEVVFTDSWVGRLLDKIEALDLSESTFVVIVGDHGESLGEHEYYFEHGARLFDNILKVPLMLRLPYEGPNGIAIDSLVRTIDIVPTVYHLLGIRPSDAVHGKSLIPLIFRLSDDAPSESYAETLLPPRVGEHELRAFTTDRYKFIFAPAVNGYALYDLRNDPDETRNVLELARENPEAYKKQYQPVLLELKKRLEDVIRSTGSGVPSIIEAPDEETKKALKALGYM
ncbi:MAG: hypothetical protein C4520_09000 [Candidatus Abyssobacteria bacterium SURF_5]|uniref:Sulfatase N-terminal domain-containing protein n=1 Tax=Abyssobacteria bacterium (strain SURF_5) TaxID=2093360 RepID=A0A3A4NTQ6_ABYX5|nr:MAG: hypothetical protein C4520_09000 [Candidatus Abyssubacteria bacterium SURF_5]